MKIHQLVTISLLALFPSALIADGDGEFLEPSTMESEIGQQKIFDKRLPPVIPGQRVFAGGSKHKVISTSGPVPVNRGLRLPRAPVAPSAINVEPQFGGQPQLAGQAGSITGPISVIVDKRSRAAEAEAIPAIK